MLSEPNPALERTRGEAFPLRVAFRRAPLSSNVSRICDGIDQTRDFHILVPVFVLVRSPLSTLVDREPIADRGG